MRKSKHRERASLCTIAAAQELSATVRRRIGRFTFELDNHLSCQFIIVFSIIMIVIITKTKRMGRSGHDEKPI